jgi:hypothetical protein
VHPGFEDLKPVDFKEVLAKTMKGVVVVKSLKDLPKKPNKALKRAVKRYKQENAPKGEPGTLIGGGDVRMTAKERHERVRLLGGDPTKIFVKGELPKGGPLMPYDSSRKIDVEFFPDLPSSDGGGN